MYPLFFKKKKQVLSLFLCLSIGLMFFTPLSAEASSLEEKKAEEEEKAQALTEQKNSLQAEVDALNASLSEISNKLEETEEEIVQTWTVAAEGDIPDAEALDILLGGEQT